MPASATTRWATTFRSLPQPAEAGSCVALGFDSARRLGSQERTPQHGLSNLDVAEISERQQLQSLDEEVTVTVDDYNIQLDLITSAKEAMDLAERAYAQTQQRFMIGKTDLSSMTLASTVRQEASKNYISALKNYWLNYYKLRRLTLFDFETGIPLTRKFDLDNNVR